MSGHDEGGTSGFTSIPEAVEAFGRGEMLLVVDDERRENEGDLIVAAEKATPESIRFMIREGGGLVCVAMTKARLAELGLARMAPAGPGDPYRTAFMVSVDAREGGSTGISAPDRARTARLLVADGTTPGDLVKPGHVFPLEAVEGGVLQRAGHTEAAVDFARMAGLKPAGVICEVMRDDGAMARRPELATFARRHGLKMVSIADLVTHRRRHEHLVVREQVVRLPTHAAVFQLHMYRAQPENEVHLALVLGDLAGGAAPLVRVHSECLTGDVFGSMRCDCGSQLNRSMDMVAAEGRGAVLYLRQEGRGIGLAHKIHAYALQETGMDTVEANQKLGFEADLRDYSAAAQILRDLGVDAVRLITNNPAKVSGLEKYGVRVEERVPLVIPPTEDNARYLRAKKQKLGHLL
ncbi:MAG: bifunctional 3,4-dihydroxy-2-butanone-4-phosphate synthase/GTP cyclohydrolase II [Verrucomicrobia bacterium]|nr:bifunctional 3,4-dihydroxy-2-butanone-4-phosphate synthase/GTP cyclohydrolase II [Verrucomicrobiota bacterium]